MRFEPNRLAAYDREAMLVEIKRVIEQHFNGHAPTQKAFNRFSRVHSATIVKQFGFWTTAMQAAGIQYVRGTVKTADLLADLKLALQKSKGAFFTAEYYRNNGGRYNVRLIKSRFGYPQWTQLLENVLDVRPVSRLIMKSQRSRRPTREQMFQELERVWNHLGRRPTYGEFRSHSKISIDAFEREFGSWTTAVSEFTKRDVEKVPFSKGTRCTPELLRSELQSIAMKTDSPTLSYEDYRARGGIYSIGTFQKHFGSWKKAVLEIGLKDGHSLIRPTLRKFSDEDFFSEIQRVWEILGRQPQAREMKQHGAKMSHQAFQDRFGSWMQAIHAFCRDRRGLELPEPPMTKVATAKIAKTVTPATLSAADQRKGDGNIIVIRKATPRQPSPRLRFRVLERDHFCCRHCGRSPANEVGVVLHVDHVIPYSDIGETVIENLQTLCSKCNFGKTDSIPQS